MVSLLAQQQSQSPSLLTSLIPFLAIGALMYFLLIRPQKRRVAEQKSLIDSLEVGDEVLTIGGVFGVIRHIDDEVDEMTLEIAPGTTIRVVRSAIARRVAEEDWADEDTEDNAGDGETP